LRADVSERIAASSIYILIALGFTLIFGILKIVNIPHGSIYRLGGCGRGLMASILHVNPFAGAGLLLKVFVIFIGKSYSVYAHPDHLIPAGRP